MEIKKNLNYFSIGPTVNVKKMLGKPLKYTLKQE